MNAQGIVDRLLEAGPDDPETFLRHYAPTPLEIVRAAHREIMALPHDDLMEFYAKAKKINQTMAAKLEKATGRKSRSLFFHPDFVSSMPRPWYVQEFNRSPEAIANFYARKTLAAFKRASKRVKK